MKYRLSKLLEMPVMEIGMLYFLSVNISVNLIHKM